MTPVVGRAESARIGPNAIIQTLAALRERNGEAVAGDILDEAGLGCYARAQPKAMVPEEDVSRLYRALRARLNERDADACSNLAGDKTAAYILAYRIPRPAQLVLRLLPPRLAAPLLLSAITKHTWTFAGSGTVAAVAHRPVRISIAGCPICRDTSAARPVCSYYAAAFEALFKALVSASAAATEVACSAQGAPACVFEFNC